MAIQTSNGTVDVSTITRTWRVNIECPNGETPYIEIFRQEIKTIGDEQIITTDTTPITVSSLDLGSLADYAVIPLDLKDKIGTVGELRSLFLLLPALVSIACDAAEAKKIADAATPEPAPAA